MQFDLKMSLKLARAATCVYLLLCPIFSRGSAVEAKKITLPAIWDAATDFHDLDPKVELLYQNGLLNTLRQVAKAPDKTIYVSTGDIPAEWLRDSSAQVLPYIYFAKDHKDVAALIRGVIARQAKCLQKNAYANAFTKAYFIWEMKFELDSLAYPMIFAWTYYKETGDKSIFTNDFGAAIDTVLDTMQREQDHMGIEHDRLVNAYTHSALPNDGKGRPVGKTGMIWTAFRPSDDACQYNFLIPSEMMAVVALTCMEDIETNVYHNPSRAQQAGRMRREVYDGIQKYGVVEHSKYGKIYAYEVDGLGAQNLMDDANIPSLLSAPYLGFLNRDDETYLNTRKFILSAENPYYFTGKIASGIGSPHTPKEHIWPLALIMQGMTTKNSDERAQLMKWLLAADPGDHVLHESFDANNQKKFTRKNFGWPNALFAEYMLLSKIGQEPLATPDLSDLKHK
jgi:meiotically up-regulated gene 157 (Mug157) protein